MAPTQVVFSGPVSEAAAHFSSLGLQPPDASVSIADFMLDAVIRSSREEVNALVDQFMASRWGNEGGAPEKEEGEEGEGGTKLP